MYIYHISRNTHSRTSRYFQDNRFDLRQYMLSTPAARRTNWATHLSMWVRSTHNEIDTVVETRKGLSRISHRIACDSLVTFHPQRWTIQARVWDIYIPASLLFFTSTWWNTTRWSASQRCKRWRKYLTTIDIVRMEASFPPEIATLFDPRVIQRRCFGKFHVYTRHAIVLS